MLEILFKWFNQFSARDYRKEIDFIEKMTNKYKTSKGKKLLDVGCGYMPYAMLLKQENFSITGIDTDSEALKIARKNFKGITFIKNDMKKLNINEKFDVITGIYNSIHYNLDIYELEKTLNNFHKHLKKGGILIFDAGFTNFVKNGKLKRILDSISNFRIITCHAIDNNIFLCNYTLILKKGRGINIKIVKGKFSIFKINLIKNLMKKIGFKVFVYDNFYFKKYTEKSQKPVFVGIKK